MEVVMTCGTSHEWGPSATSTHWCHSYSEPCAQKHSRGRQASTHHHHDLHHQGYNYEPTINIHEPMGPLEAFVSRYGISCGAAVRGSDLSDFLYRSLGAFATSHATLVLALYYIDRLINGKFKESDKNSVCGHCLAVSCLIIAAKFLEDTDRPSNKMWAIVAGLTLWEVNALEIMALGALEYDLNVSELEFDAFRVEYENDPVLSLWHSHSRGLKTKKVMS